MSDSPEEEPSMSDEEDNPDLPEDNDDDAVPGLDEVPEKDGDSAKPEAREVSSLRDLSMSAVLKLLTSSEQLPVSLLDPLTPEMKCEVVIKLDQIGGCSALVDRLLSSAEVLLPALSVTSKRTEMFAALQRPFHCNGKNFISAVSKSVDDKLKADPAEAALHFPQIAALVSILLDSAWPRFAQVVLSSLLTCYDETSSEDMVIGTILILLNAMTMQLKLAEAEELVGTLSGLRVLSDDNSMDDIRSMQLRATYNMECSKLHLERSNFKLAYSMAMKAVNCLREEHPVRLVVDVYRIASRASVMKRKYDIAKVFVREAFLLACNKLGRKHVTFAEACADLGFYFQHTSSRWRASRTYDDALQTIRSVFYGRNYNALGRSQHEVRIHELMAQMELDTYIKDVESLCDLIEYGDDRERTYFWDSGNDCATSDWDRMCSNWRDHLGHSSHPLAANCRRIAAVLGLRGDRGWVLRRKLRGFWRRGSKLSAAELKDLDGEVDHIKDELLSSLDVAERTFGRNSLQIARHLDSLGYFYWKTLRLSSAESALNHALSVKESVLGHDDLEVAATLRQLAIVHCLRREFDRAAQLFVRCVDITKKANTCRDHLACNWLGSYDRLLVMCYRKTGNSNEIFKWTLRRNEWWALHDGLPIWVWVSPLDPERDLGTDEPQPLASVVEELKRLGAFQ